MSSEIERDYNWLDSFVIFMGIQGNVELMYGDNEKCNMQQGETVLIPASVGHVFFQNESDTAKIIEVYID